MLASPERTIILVKAWPQPSPKYGETVCCAGITPEGEWRRLFPIRFRHLSGDQQFKRWDIVEYRPEMPKDDHRAESRRVDEPTLKKVGSVPERSRAALFAPLIQPSCAAAAAIGSSLSLVRPLTFSLRWKKKSDRDFAIEKAARAATLKQGSLWEKELAQIEPCPYEISMHFEDADGAHKMKCGDWETPATFFHWRKQYGDIGALERLKAKYEVEYQKAGVAFALGTMAQYPQTWMLLGVVRLNESAQLKLI